MFKKILIFFFNQLITFRLYYILVIIYLFLIKKYNNNFFSFSFRDNKKVLALGASKYRGDLNNISKFKNYDLYSVDHRWQSLFRRYFCSSNDILNYLNPKKNSVYFEEKKELISFMKIFIEKLNKIFKLNLVTVVNYRYIDDYFWLEAIKENNIKIVMLYREGLLAFDRVTIEVENRHKLFRNYPVDYIITQNNISKEVFIKSKFINENKIYVSGALRMDDFFQKIKNKKYEINLNKKINILYFTIPESLSLFGKNFYNLTPEKYNYVFNFWKEKNNFIKDINKCILNIAQQTNTLITIRPKLYEANKKIHSNIINEVKNYKGNNITIDYFTNTHDLILNSDIIIGMQSTTILESLIANKLVILPLFRNFKNSAHFNDLMFKEYLHLFKVFEEPEKLINYIANFTNSKSIMKTGNHLDDKIELWNKYFFTNKSIVNKLYENNFNKILN